MWQVVEVTSNDHPTGPDRADSRWWKDWAAARPATDVLHLDSAAVGRQSRATLDAVAAHALLEAETGGYVAQDLVAPALETLRADVGTLLGTDADGVAFVESAAVALDVLIDAWPLPAGARIAVAGSEWGPNVETLLHRGHAVVPLAVDGHGVIDLDALARLLATDPPDVVLVDHVAAHRGLVQPAVEVAALGRAHGVPVWVDAAQAIGHVDAVTGADAVVATSRKWLTGPRGVGMLAIAPEHRATLRLRRLAKHDGWPDVRHLESDEAHVAGRVGLGVAVREHLAVGTPHVVGRLAVVGDLVREAFADVPGWQVVDPDAPAGATTALVPTAGQDVDAARSLLLEEHRIVTSVGLPWRAPEDMRATGATLRLSPHVDLTTDDLERVRRALAAR